MYCSPRLPAIGVDRDLTRRDWRGGLVNPVPRGDREDGWTNCWRIPSTESRAGVTRRLTDPVRPVDAMRRLRTRFPHAVHLEWQPEGGAGAALRYSEAVRGRTDLEIAEAFIADCRGSEPTERERDLLVAALEAAGRANPERKDVR